MEKDLQKKSYFSDEKRFADLINGIVGAGKTIVTSSDLTDMDSQTGTAGIQTAERKTRKRYPGYRDLVKKAAFGVNFMVIGVENQEKVHFLMPLRCMAYDADEYKRQAKTAERNFIGGIFIRFYKKGQAETMRYHSIILWGRMGR